MPAKPKTTKPGHVRKIVPPYADSQKEKAEIVVPDSH